MAQGRKNQNQTSLFDPQTPAITETEEWKGFADMRRAMKKPLTERAISLAVAKLDQLAPGNVETQKAILDQSTLRCWLSLYPLEKPQRGAPNQGAPRSASYDMEELERYIREVPIFDQGGG